MVLSDNEIRMEIENGGLVFNPTVHRDQIKSSSVDLHLSSTFITFKPPTAGVKTTVDLRKVNVQNVIKDYGDIQTRSDTEAFELEPRQFVLAYTREYITLPNYLAGRVEGRSSLARLGITIHQTAPTVHAIFEGQLALEIINNGPFTYELYPGYIICQLILERLGNPAKGPSYSQFQYQREPSQ